MTRMSSGRETLPGRRALAQLTFFGGPDHTVTELQNTWHSGPPKERRFYPEGKEIAGIASVIGASWAGPAIPHQRTGFPPDGEPRVCSMMKLPGYREVQGGDHSTGTDDVQGDMISAVWIPRDYSVIAVMPASVQKCSSLRQSIQPRRRVPVPVMVMGR